MCVRVRANVSLHTHRSLSVSVSLCRNHSLSLPSSLPPSLPLSSLIVFSGQFLFLRICHTTWIWRAMSHTWTSHVQHENCYRRGYRNVSNSYRKRQDSKIKESKWLSKSKVDTKVDTKVDAHRNDSLQIQGSFQRCYLKRDLENFPFPGRFSHVENHKVSTSNLGESKFYHTCHHHETIPSIARSTNCH